MRKFFKILIPGIIVLLLIVVVYFFLIRKMDNDITETNDFYNSSYDIKSPVLIPSSFLDGERFFIKLPSASGDSIMAFCDTGGGISMLLPAAIDKFKVHSKVKTGILKGFFKCDYIEFNELVSDISIPPPEPMRNLNIRSPFKRVAKPYLLIPPMDDELKFLSETIPLDAFLAQNFFMHKSWTFDYLKKEIWVNTPINLDEKENTGVQKLGFKKNAIGKNIFGHPSLAIQVDGENIDVLFDTGATIILSKNGKQILNTSAISIGGSFIAKSIFDKWHTNHPEWKYYEKADLHNDLIEVPEINICGYKVGPVLFAQRADEEWSENMIYTMDKVVKGAIGGSALKYLKVTIDYNSELIKFAM
jgi:hypothetical protein